MLDCVSTNRAADERGEIMNGKRFALGCGVVFAMIYKPADA